MHRALLRLRELKDRGATAIEYALLAALIACAIVLGAASAGDRVDAVLTAIAARLGGAATATAAPDLSSTGAVMARYVEPAIAGSGAAVEVGTSLFGQSGTRFVLASPDGSQSFRMAYSAYEGAFGTVWHDYGVIENGFITVSERLYGPGGQRTRMAYINGPDGYATRVEMNIETGEVVATERFDSTSQTWVRSDR